MGWLSPTGYEDPDSWWQYETQAYDDNTTTYAGAGSALECQIFGWLVLTHAAIQCNKVRVMIWQSYTDQHEVQVRKDGEWVQVFLGILPPNQWKEIEFAEGQVDAMRIRAHSLGDPFSPAILDVYEADFWEVEAAPVGYQYSDGLVTIQC